MSGVRAICLVFAAFLLSCASGKVHGYAPQQPGGRDPVINSGTKESTRRTTKKDPPKPRLAELTIMLPHDCHLFINGQAIEYRRTRDLLLRSQKVRLEYTEASRSVTLKGLKPDPYVVTASKAGYNDYTRSIDVSASTTNLITVDLQLKPGILTVSPGVNGAQITVTSLETGMRFGPYPNQLNAAEIVPGSYRLNVSRDGYYALTRDFTIHPGETVYLEPQLEPKPVPKPTPTPTPTLIIPVVAQSASVERSGKYLIFRIVGASGNSSQTLGTITTQFYPTSESTAVEGVLPGVAARVSFVKLLNVAEGSLIESPAPSNQWSLVVIRIRPKDSKRPVRFAINWISISPPVP